MGIINAKEDMDPHITFNLLINFLITQNYTCDPRLFSVPGKEGSYQGVINI
jgi:hypothetical protein